MFLVVLIIGFLISIAGNDVSLRAVVETRSSTKPNKTTTHIETKQIADGDIDGRNPAPLAAAAALRPFQKFDAGSHTDAGLSAIYFGRKSDFLKGVGILPGRLKPRKILNSDIRNRIRTQARRTLRGDPIRSAQELKIVAVSTVAPSPPAPLKEEQSDGRRNKSREKLMTTTTTTCRRHAAVVASSPSPHVSRDNEYYYVRSRLASRFSRGRRQAAKASAGGANNNHGVTVPFSSVATVMGNNEEWEVGDVGHRTRRRQRTTTMGIIFTRVRAEIFIQKAQISKKVTAKTSSTQSVIIALLVIVVVAIVVVIVVGIVKKSKVKPGEIPKADEKKPLIPPGTPGAPPSQVTGATAPSATKTPAEQAAGPVLMLDMVKSSAPTAGPVPADGTSGPPGAPSSSVQPGASPAEASPFQLSSSVSSPASPHPRIPPTQPTSTTSAPPSMVSRAPGAPLPIAASKGALALTSKASVAQPPVPPTHKAPSSSAPPATPTGRK